MGSTAVLTWAALLASAAALQPPLVLLARARAVRMTGASAAGDAASDAGLLVASTALGSDRLHRTPLRQLALDGLVGMRQSSSPALARERDALCSRAERKVVVPAVVALLLLRRLAAREAFVVFLLARLASAFVVRRQPDPAELVPWSVAARAALRSSTLALEAAGLLSLAAALAASAVCATGELCTRMLISQADALARWIANGHLGPILVRLRASPSEAWQTLADGSRALAGRVAERARGFRQSPGTATALREEGAAPTAASIKGSVVVPMAANASADGGADDPSSPSAARAAVQVHRPPPPAAEVARAVPVDTTGDGEADAVLIDSNGDGLLDTLLPRLTNASLSTAAVAAKLRKAWERASAVPPVDAAADAAAREEEAAGVQWYATSSSASHELALLVRRALVQAAVHVLLASAAALWACEAAFVLLLALGQRLRLVALAAGAATRARFDRALPATRQMITTLPRSTEEVAQQFNYQLNLIGLQSEQWMTDTWARYLRQRQKWMRGASAKAKPKGRGGGGGQQGGAGWGWGASLGNWWDERVVATKRGWVDFQIDSARRRSQGPMGASAPSSKGAASKGAASTRPKVEAAAPTPKKPAGRGARPTAANGGSDTPPSINGAAAEAVTPQATDDEHVAEGAFGWWRWRPVSRSSFSGRSSAHAAGGGTIDPTLTPDADDASTAHATPRWSVRRWLGKGAEASSAHAAEAGAEGEAGRHADAPSEGPEGSSPRAEPTARSGGPGDASGEDPEVA